MLNSGNEGTMSNKSLMECKRDYEEEIKNHKSRLKVIVDMKNAIEGVRDINGVPHGKEGIYFCAQYGDAIFEIARLERNINSVLEAQEKDGKNKP